MGMHDRFRQLHSSGFFVLPNAWDVGSAVRFARSGAAAVATTSSGYAMSLGRDDQSATFDELCTHVEAVVGAVGVPVSVDAERLFASTAEGVAANVAALSTTGAAGLSIEDYDPVTDAIDDLEVATARVEAAASEARSRGLVLTARAENLLYGIDDLDDTITRLVAYGRAGADVLYAPGLVDAGDIETLLAAVDRPVNVLLRPGAPAPAELARLGVRRVSTGGRLARIAYDAACSELADLLSGAGA